MVRNLRNVLGFRGERIVELCLSEYREFAAPLFSPGFLGDRWPAIDFYVELNEVPGKRLYFFAQAKATASSLTNDSGHLIVSTKKADVGRLLSIPGPTYILGVHEPSQRVFVRSVHTGIPVAAITRIPVSHELTGTNLRLLHEEVRDFWLSTGLKPTRSVFA
jgi:hypothetical protein